MTDLTAQVPESCQRTTLPSTGGDVLVFVLFGALAIPLGAGLIWLAKRQPTGLVALLIIGASIGVGARSVSAASYPSCPSGYELIPGYTTTTAPATTTSVTTTTTTVPDTTTTVPDISTTVPDTSTTVPFTTVPFTTVPFTTVPFTTVPEFTTTNPGTTVPDPTTTNPSTTAPTTTKP